MICGLLLLALLVPMLGGFPVSAADDADQTHTKNKVVSVVYDNSGSMTSENRWHYSRYAIQTLMALLGPNDRLIITPMNRPGYNTAVSDLSYNIEVDLKAENRKAAMEDAMNKAALLSTPKGETPSASINHAIQTLQNAGMKRLSETTASDKNENEYFLIVLTDGALDNDTTGGKATNALFAALDGANVHGDYNHSANKGDSDPYASFQLLYLAFSQGAVDLSGSALGKEYTNFTAYKAATPADVTGTMRDVANRITGRYSLDPSGYTLSGNKVTLDLDKVDFSLRSISIMMQDTKARLDSGKITYSGGDLSVWQDVAIGVDLELADEMDDGFSAVLKRASSADIFSGGKVELVFNQNLTAEDMNNFSVLLEPALSLVPIISADVDGKRTEIDGAYVNSQMKPGDFIYVSYAIFEEGSGDRVSLDSIFGKVVDTVSYGGAKYDVNDPIALKEGSGEVSISVSVMDGTYTLYASLPLVVLTQPSFFRIEAMPPQSVGGNPAVTETVFKVYDDNVLINDNTRLAQYKPSVTARTESGEELSLAGIRYENGQIIAKLDVTGKLFGNYVLEAKVTSPDGNPRTVTCKVPFYPGSVSLVTEGETSHSMTLHQFLTNDKGYTFVLSADGLPMEFSNSMVSYTVKVGTADVTAYAVADGDRLTFVPTKEALGGLADQVANHKVTVSVTVPISATQNDTVSAEADLALTKTIFEVVPVNKNEGAVNRFRLGKNQVSAYFRVLRDGVALPEDELTAALNEGVFTVDHTRYGSFLSPLDSEDTVVMLDGEAAVRVRFCSGHGSVLPFLLTSMFVFGDSKDVAVSYDGITAEQTVPLAPVNFFAQYVVRILVYLYIIQLIIVAVTFKSTDRFPQGAIIEVKLDRKDNTRVQKSSSVLKIIGLMDHLVLVRLIPYIGLFLQKGGIDVRGISLICHDKIGNKGGGGGKKGEQIRHPSKASAKIASGGGTSNLIVAKMKGRMKSGKSLKSAVVLTPDEIGQTVVEITDKGTKQNVAIPLGEANGPVTKRGTVLLFVKKVKK